MIYFRSRVRLPGKLETQKQNAATGTSDKSLCVEKAGGGASRGWPKKRKRERRGCVMEEGEIRDCGGKYPTGEGEIRQEKGKE